MNYRNTPNLDEGFLEEARAKNCIAVPLEVFEAVLNAQCALEGNCRNLLGRLCELEVMEDYHHGYVSNGVGHVSAAYLRHHKIPVDAATLRAAYKEWEAPDYLTDEELVAAFEAGKAPQL